MANPLRKTMVYLGLADEDYETTNCPPQPSQPRRVSSRTRRPSLPFPTPPRSPPWPAAPGDTAAPRHRTERRTGNERDPDRAPAALQGRADDRRELP